MKSNILGGMGWVHGSILSVAAGYLHPVVEFHVKTYLFVHWHFSVRWRVKMSVVVGHILLAYPSGSVIEELGTKPKAVPLKVASSSIALQQGLKKGNRSYLQSRSDWCLAFELSSVWSLKLCLHAILRLAFLVFQIEKGLLWKRW